MFLYYGQRPLRFLNMETFKKAAGLNQNGEVDPKTFKGILSTDAVVLGSMGDSRIQEIQRGLNSHYSDCFWIDLNICPVDGVYGKILATPFYTGVVDGKYKMDVSGSFSPMVNLGTLPANQKITLAINDGQFDKLQYESSVAAYGQLDESMQVVFGDSKTLQPAISIANTVSNGNLTLAFYLDSAGNPVFDIQVEQVAMTPTGEVSVYVESMYTFNKNMQNPEDVSSMETNVESIALSSLILLALIAIVVGIPTAFAGVLPGLTFLAGMVTV